MLLIDQKGKRSRSICRECRRLHAPKDCAYLESKIILSLNAAGWDAAGFVAVAGRLGVSIRRVLNTSIRTMQAEAQEAVAMSRERKGESLNVG